MWWHDVKDADTVFGRVACLQGSLFCLFLSLSGFRQQEHLRVLSLTEPFGMKAVWISLLSSGCSTDQGYSRDTSLVAQMVKRLSTMWETRVQSLCRKDPLEKEMAIYSSTIAWKIPRREEPGRLRSMGSQRVGHDWATSLSFFLSTNICGRKEWEGGGRKEGDGRNQDGVSFPSISDDKFRWRRWWFCIVVLESG